MTKLFIYKYSEVFSKNETMYENIYRQASNDHTKKKYNERVMYVRIKKRKVYRVVNLGDEMVRRGSCAFSFFTPRSAPNVR